MNEDEKPPHGLAYYDKSPLTEAAWNREGLAIEDYCVAFAVNEKAFGSGTLVSIDGKRFILTAAHVIGPFLQSKEPLHLVIMRKEHCFAVERDELQVALGQGPGRTEYSGPDLALVSMTARIESVLASHKSFYLIGLRSVADYARAEHCTWLCCGTPLELSPTNGEGKVRRLSTTLLLTQGTQPTIEERDGFDYVTLEVRAGELGNPEVFNAMSGGGIWVTQPKQSMSRGTFSVPDAALVGVVFAQRDVSRGSGQLIGHGEISLLWLREKIGG